MEWVIDVDASGWVQSAWCIIALEISGAINSIMIAAIASHVPVRQANVPLNKMLPKSNLIDESVADLTAICYKKRHHCAIQQTRFNCCRAGLMVYSDHKGAGNRERPGIRGTTVRQARRYIEWGIIKSATHVFHLQLRT